MQKNVGHAGVQGRRSLHGHIGTSDYAYKYAHMPGHMWSSLPYPLPCLSHGTEVKISSPGLGRGAVPWPPLQDLKHAGKM